MLTPMVAERPSSWCGGNISLVPRTADPFTFDDKLQLPAVGKRSKHDITSTSALYGDQMRLHVACGPQG
jgi:hypothetical protein